MQALTVLDMDAINEHALTREYGPKEAFGVTGAVPDEFRAQMGVAILAVAGADGVVSHTELTYLLGRARMFGVSDAGLQRMAEFDYRSSDVQVFAAQVPPPFRKLLLYDAIMVARADGFAEKEREAARRWAGALGLDVSLVDQIEQHLATEDALRAQRIALITG